MKRKSMNIKNKKKNESDSVHRIKQLPNTPRYDYMQGSYRETYYNQTPYSRQNLSSIPSSRSKTLNRIEEKPNRYTETKQGDTYTRPSNPRRERKKRKSIYMKRIFFLILFIIGVIYIASIVIQAMQKPVISYQMVQRGMLDNAEILSGLIIRNEQVVMSEETGNMYMLVGESERVKKAGDVYQILDPSQLSVLEQDIQKVESDIERVQSKRQEISYYQNELQEVSNNITNHVEEFYMVNKPGKMSSTHELKKEIEYEINNRKNIHMKDNTATLSSLKSQKSDLSVQIRKSQKTYKAPIAGTVSYYIDGYETDFTVENIDSVTEKDINKKYTYENTAVNEIIQQGEPAYKIIEDEKWYIVCFMPKAWAERFKEGQKYPFITMEESSTELMLKVENNIDEGKKHKIIFSSREQQEVFLDKRTISFKSLQYKYEGLKIPISSIAERTLIKIPSEYIVEHEDGKGVLKKIDESSENLFLNLSIQYADDNGYTYVLQDFSKRGILQLGDNIINPSKNDEIYKVSEVSTISGVYAVNGRITKFKQIQILTQNDEYAIVQSNSINGLKQFDQIVTNPKNIQEEQLLRDMDVQNIKK